MTILTVGLTQVCPTCAPGHQQEVDARPPGRGEKLMFAHLLVS
jgi:hypothetical protein